ncbi:hypothetical protein TGAM01_v209453 [Trichoderma gamsii]|uniref:Uncharacterized protein n=1 Tax=Trichoderma gamsii TaxID=398673 RepID=A0A2P4ZBS7_9HYPO|nr:hypothetical protein TGAM01_v209453 [Trichoderma gamsii]PON21715.1 hypothetical protein TGAM01_v209453 [Trichoderma gamsii]
MVKHSGIPSDAPLVLDSPKKTDTDDSAWDVAVARCLPTQPVCMLVRFYICFVAAASHTKYLAPSSDFYFAPNPINCLYQFEERETTIWRVAQKTALARSKLLQRESLLALQIPAINSTAGVQHGVAAPPLLYSRRATGGVICNFHVSRRLSPQFIQTFTRINLPGIGRQDCACQRRGFSKSACFRP